MKLLAGLLLAGMAFAQSTSRTFDRPCREVKPAATRAMIENDFQPTVIDKESGLSTFAYPKIIPINSRWGQRKAADAFIVQFVKVPSYARGYGGARIVNLRIDSASLLFDGREGKCGVTVKLNYALFIEDAGWQTAETSSVFEGRLLDKTDLALGKMNAP